MDTYPSGGLVPQLILLGNLFAVLVLRNILCDRMMRMRLLGIGLITHYSGCLYIGLDWICRVWRGSCRRQMCKWIWAAKSGWSMASLYFPPTLLESTDMTCVFEHYYYRTPAAGQIWRPAFLVRDGLSPSNP